MKTTKKYTAIQIDTENIDSNLNIKLSYGEITGPYYSLQYPQKEFDTEQKAIEYAYLKDKHSSWLIIPIITFDKN